MLSAALNALVLPLHTFAAAGLAAAGVAYALLNGIAAEPMLRLANAIGGLAVTKIGPMEGSPSLADALAAAGL